MTASLDVRADGCRVEIVGVAGAGKSTLTRTLCERGRGWRVAEDLHTRARSQWPYVLHAAPRVLALLAHGAAARPWLSWDELKFLVYVVEWERFLHDRPEYRHGVTILDQGPIFALARLEWAAKPVVSSPAYRRWRADMLRRWSAALDVVVWLDAPDAILIERIDAREQSHAAKGKPSGEALAFIAAYRRAYESLLVDLERLGGARVLRFDTAQSSADDVASALSRGLAADEAADRRHEPVVEAPCRS